MTSREADGLPGRIDALANGMSHAEAQHAPQEPTSTGLMGRCPRCGEGKLFSGFLSLAPSCSACGLDFKFADSADGPAFFIVTAVGFIVAGAALIVEIAHSPPIWVHVVLWGPLVLILCLGLLRPLKGMLVALQYSNRAEPGRIDRGT